VSQTGRFIDSFGFLWQVVEVAPTNAQREARALADVPGWLYFCSRGCTMVLRRYPADWQRLDWHELDALRMRAEVLSSDITRSPRATPGGTARITADV